MAARSCRWRSMRRPRSARSRMAGTVSPCCTRRHRGSVRSISAWCRARAGLMPLPSPAVAWMSSSTSAPTRSKSRPGPFVVYVGTHGDRGAHRADVILPGATYTEKAGLTVNTEGRVQVLNRAGFAPGDAREDWAILRALSDQLGVKLPFDSLGELRAALGRDLPGALRVGSLAAADAGALVEGCSPWRGGRRPAVQAGDRRFLPDQSDRAGFGHACRMFRARPWGDADCGRVRGQD